MLLGTVAADADFLLGMETVGLFVELEGVRQQLEHDDRRAEWAKYALVTIQVYSPATGERISEFVVRPPPLAAVPPMSARKARKNFFPGAKPISPLRV